MVKKHEYNVSEELCSELMKKPKNKHVILKYFNNRVFTGVLVAHVQLVKTLGEIANYVYT